jgi:TRAP transporter TAXI family solute receptor
LVEEYDGFLMPYPESCEARQWKADFSSFKLGITIKDSCRMNTTKYRKRGIAFCQCFVLAFLAVSCAKEEVPSFLIGTGGLAGNYHSVGSALRRILANNPATSELQFDEKTSSGSVFNINAIARGEIQFGIAQADHQYQAVNGLDEWSDKGPQTELRAVFALYADSVTLVAGADTDIRSMGDLKGKPVDIGAPGSGTRSNAIDGLRAAGIDWQKDIEVSQANLDDRLTMFMRSEIDAFFYTVGHPSKEIKFATFSVRGARIIPLNDIDNLVDSSPFYSRVLIPSGTYPMANNDVDIETIGVYATLLTSAQVSEDVVYAITKAVFENVESSEDFRSEFGALLSDQFSKGLTAPMHPGAAKYYREVGISVP